MYRTGTPDKKDKEPLAVESEGKEKEGVNLGLSGALTQVCFGQNRHERKYIYP